MSKKKDSYREFCKTKQNLPVFLYDWWLDAVCGTDNWDVAIVKPDNDILAFFPYYNKKVLFFDISTLPQLTQFLGPWINYPNDLKQSNRTEYEKKMMNELIKQLPAYHHFEQNFHYSVDNWLPFYWKGYEQTTKYTYVIEDISFPDRVFENFTPSKRKNIRKAEELVEIKFDMSSDDFYEHHKKTLSKQNLKISYSKELFKSIYDAVYSHNAGRTIYALDKDNNIHSALFVVWTKYSAYDLISSIDPDFKNSESASLLVWEIIKSLSGKAHRFDFEGSMIESVERSFRQFGTVQKAYFNIKKCDSLSYRIFRKIREKFRN
ncbi:MAG: GNAT family N-acetyltransferase [Candidatus Delongbacteria bacterium]|nr:GNAT family N-acetyltransferase [Candidatus Delongbacteria bacterium]MCG2760162.1 GNAT family N-acetyltransferase [Candidatus Delongbacteria bacterium]